MNFCVYSSVPPPSRPQDSGNWIQFWVVSCDFPSHCICVCNFLSITLRLTSKHWSQSRDVKHHRDVETSHDIILPRKNHSSFKYSRQEMNHQPVTAITWYEPSLIMFKGYMWCLCVCTSSPADGALNRAASVIRLVFATTTAPPAGFAECYISRKVTSTLCDLMWIIWKICQAQLKWRPH